MADSSGKLLPFMENFFGIYMVVITVGFIFLVVGLIGMFLRATWARYIFLIAVILHLLTMAVTKYNSSSGLESMFTYIEAMITGVILFLVFSDIGKKFFIKDK